MDYSQAYQLAKAIKESEEYQTYHALKADVMGEETVAALIKESKKLQVALQMATLSGQTPDADEMQRFQAISALLYSKPEVSQYQLSEMRLQQTIGDIFKIITDAAGLDIELPGIE